MSPRIKKAAILTVKIAILVGLLEYARRQAQIDDEIAVPEGGVAFHDEYLGPGVRLKVVDVKKAADGAPLAYGVTTPGGAKVEIPAADTRFSLLPGLATLFHGLEWRYLGFAFASFGPPLFLMVVRWRLLLVASGVRVPFWI